MSSSTSSSNADAAVARKLTIRLLLFLLPFVLFPGVPIGVALMAGELTPLATVAARQAREPLLYGRAYRDDYFAFKLIAAEQRRPDVLVLGSSRVMQFRASMFDGSGAKSFYNAGGAASTLADVVEFYRHLRRTVRPRLMIVGLDQVWLTSEPQFALEKLAMAEGDAAADLQRMIRVSHRVVDDLFGGKISLSRLFQGTDRLHGAPALGMSAIMMGSGFRPDGSYQYGLGRGKTLPLAERLREGFERLDQNVVPMVRASSISAEAIGHLQELLELTTQDGTKVIGFCPPFAPTTLSAIRQSGGFGYLDQIPSRLGAVFAEYGYGFMDWSDPAPLGVGDDDMIDYFHPSEDIVRRIYARMVAADTQVSSSELAGGGDRRH